MRCSIAFLFCLLFIAFYLFLFPFLGKESSHLIQNEYSSRITHFIAYLCPCLTFTLNGILKQCLAGLWKGNTMTGLDILMLYTHTMNGFAEYCGLLSQLYYEIRFRYRHIPPSWPIFFMSLWHISILFLHYSVVYFMHKCSRGKIMRKTNRQTKKTGHFRLSQNDFKWYTWFQTENAAFKIISPK